MNGVRKNYLAIVLCLAAAVCLLSISIFTNRMVTVFSASRPLSNRMTIIIDAGHGGVDGGATSCTGVLESSVNLDIAMRLNDLFHLLGIKTRMIRTTDCSIHTEGESIAAKKVSDLKERVRIVNETDNAILISIHQNYFTDSKYFGAQTFYGPSDGSKELACQFQGKLAETLMPGNKRVSKKADGIYLMEHIKKCGVLLECGFISNPQENARLSTPQYQKNLCSVIACTISTYIKDS